MIIDELQAANISALKSQDKTARAVLSVVISRYKLQAIEIKAGGREPNDSDVVKVINKVLKELAEEKEGYAKLNRVEDVKNIETQEKVLEKYLPKLMSESEIRAIISSLEDKSMPSIMKHFKANYDGQVDMALVSKIARE